MDLDTAIATLQRIRDADGHGRRELAVAVHNPGGLGATPCVPVSSLASGIDWDQGRVLLTPDQALTALLETKDALAVFDALASIARSRRRLLKKKASRAAELHPEAQCTLDRIDYVLEEAAIAREYLAAHSPNDPEFAEMVRRGTSAWRDVSDDWLEDLRGGAER